MGDVVSLPIVPRLRPVVSEAEWKAAQMKLVVALRRNLQRSMAELAAIDMDEAQVTLADLGHFIDSQKTDGA